MSHRSRSRHRHHEPNMSVKSGTYQIHLSIPRSLMPGNISMKTANHRQRPMSPFERRPTSPATRPTSTFEQHSPRSHPMRPSIFNVSLPMENNSTQKQLTTQNEIPVPDHKGNSTPQISAPNGQLPSPRYIPNGNALTSRSVSNGHSLSPRSLPVQDDSVYIPSMQNDIKPPNDTTLPVSSQILYRVGSKSAKVSVARSKSFTTKHYIQKSGRSGTPNNTLPRSMSPPVITPNSTLPRSMSPPSMSTPRSLTNGSQRIKSHVAMVTPGSFEDSLTAKSVLDTSVNSKGSFRANMYETYRDLCWQK